MTTTRAAPIDLMIEFAMEELLSGNPQRRRTMIRKMAERWPSEPVLALVFAVTSATGLIEDSLGGAGSDPVVPLGYRLSALISADVHAVQSMGQNPSLAADLLHFSRRADPLFLRLQ
jgi:hypothetical protein